MAADALSLPPVPPPAPAAHPARDRIVATMFALAIALPGIALVFTWSNSLTRFENRPAAPWPSASFARSFPPAFERAFADRFGARDALVWLHHSSLLGLFGVSARSTVLVGRDGWYYWLGEDGHSLARHYRGTLPFTLAEVADTAAELERRRAWLAARGIAYVVVAVPEKFNIYPEHLPQWVRRAPPPTPQDRVRSAIARDTQVRFVDLRGPLLAAKEREQVYYRTDSHWNYNGAVVGYGEIMRAVQQALPAGALAAIASAPRPPFVRGVDYFSGDLGKMLGLPGLVREDDVAPLAKVLGDTAGRCAKRDPSPLDPALYPPAEDPQVYTCDQPGLPRAVIMRDSMAIPLLPLLSENFSRVLYISTRKFDHALIERERPDVVIEEMVERSLHAPGAFPSG